jgi:hypothetical protein
MKPITLFAILSLAIMLNAGTLQAQQDVSKCKFDLTLDVVNRFVWRGIFLDDKLNFQPGLSSTKGNFTLAAWGSYNIASGYAQTNFYTNYKVAGFTFQVMDHYVGNDTSDVNYFEYNNSKTKHLLEGSVQYSVKGFSFLASSFFYGNDKKANGNNRYSSYAEIGYNLLWDELVTFDFFAGCSLNDGIYSKDAKLVSLGVKASKKIKVNENYSIPFSFTIASNPDKKKMYFIACLSF